MIPPFRISTSSLASLYCSYHSEYFLFLVAHVYVFFFFLFIRLQKFGFFTNLWICSSWRQRRYHLLRCACVFSVFDACAAWRYSIRWIFVYLYFWVSLEILFHNQFVRWFNCVSLPHIFWWSLLLFIVINKWIMISIRANQLLKEPC